MNQAKRSAKSILHWRQDKKEQPDCGNIPSMLILENMYKALKL